MSKIFLVDDDADDRLLFSEALEEIDPSIQLFTASNGRNALTRLRHRDISPPDIFFLDINMPLIDGWKLIDAIKADEIYRNIPVIMYSTSSFPEDIEKASEHGALCFFTKPCDFEELKGCLESVVKHLEDNTIEHLADDSTIFSVAHR